MYILVDKGTSSGYSHAHFVSGPHHYGSKNRTRHLKDRNRTGSLVEHGSAREPRWSVAVAFSSPFQTGDRYESGSVSQVFPSAKGGDDAAHNVSRSETDCEAGGDSLEQSLRARLPEDVRHDAGGLSQDALARDEGEEVAKKAIVATFDKI